MDVAQDFLGHQGFPKLPFIPYGQCQNICKDGQLACISTIKSNWVYAILALLTIVNTLLERQITPGLIKMKLNIVCTETETNMALGSKISWCFKCIKIKDEVKKILFYKGKIMYINIICCNLCCPRKVIYNNQKPLTMWLLNIYA